MSRILLLAAVVVLSVCFSIMDSGGDSSGNRIDTGLQDRVRRYYELEKEGNWEKTYLYRTPLYRDSISFDSYRQNMEKNNAGWQLLEYKILESSVNQFYAAFRIEFIEKVPEGYFPLDLHKTIKLTQVSTWEKIDGTWYCRDACSRTHLTMNGDLVMRDDQNAVSIKFPYEKRDNY